MQIKRTFLLFLLGSLCANQFTQASTILQVQGELTQSLEYNCFNTSVIQGIIQEKIDARLFDDVNAIQSMLEAHKALLLKKTSCTISNKIAKVARPCLCVPMALAICGRYLGFIVAGSTSVDLALENEFSKSITLEDYKNIGSLILTSLKLGVTSLPLLGASFALNDYIRAEDSKQERYKIQLQKVDELLTYIAVQKALSAAQETK